MQSRKVERLRDNIQQLLRFVTLRRGPKLEGCALANFGNSSGTEGEPSQKKREKWGKKRKKEK